MDKINQDNKFYFKQCITAFNERCDLEYVVADDFSVLDDSRITKVHSICLDEKTGNVCLVYFKSYDVWGLPGGTREPGESIIQTLEREIIEETNCKIINQQPIGYYKIISPTDANKFQYHLIYLSFIDVGAEWTNDVTGSVTKIVWIDPTEFEMFIEDKEFKKLPWKTIIANRKHFHL